MIDFINNKSPIYICDIGASPIDKTDFIDDLYNNSNSKIIGFEPKLALNGGLDGLSEVRKIIFKSSELIKKKGKFVLEINFDQRREVKNLLEINGFYINKIVRDLAKNDRCIVSTRI